MSDSIRRARKSEVQKERESERARERERERERERNVRSAKGEQSGKTLEGGSQVLFRCRSNLGHITQL